MARERKKISKESKQQAKKLLSFLKPYRGLFVVGMIFLILSTATTMLFPYLLGKLLDADNSQSTDGLDLSNLSDINNIALILLIIFVSQAIFSFFRIYFFAKITQGTIADIRTSAFGNIIKLPISFFDKTRVGELISRITADTTQLETTIMTTFPEFIRGILTIVIGVAIIAFQNIELTLVILSVLPVIVIVAIVFGKYIKRLSKNTQQVNAESNIVVEETLSGVKAVKSYANESYEISRYSKVANSIKQIAIKTGVWRGAFISTMIFMSFGTIILFIWYASHLKADGHLLPGELAGYLMYVIFIGTSFGGMAQNLSNIQKAIGASERIVDLIQEESEIIEEKKNRVQLKGNIRFDNVQFSYPSRKETEVLKGISFEINEGEQLALVGASGSGKSTIASLLLNFYDINSGSISYDGKNQNDLDLNELRSNIAVVPQEVILFGGTILENIQYGKPGASKEEIIEAAKKANANDFISKFPEGYNTIVGDRGIQLSGGQRQRIAIARAVLNDPAILILDEATSALDSESEHLVQEALEKLMKGRSSVVIAHRLSTIKNADNILVIEEGKIIESGKHDDLVYKKGAYSKLVSLQKT